MRYSNYEKMINDKQQTNKKMTTTTINTAQIGTSDYNSQINKNTFNKVVDNSAQDALEITMTTVMEFIEDHFHDIADKKIRERTDGLRLNYYGEDDKSLSKPDLVIRMLVNLYTDVAKRFSDSEQKIFSIVQGIYSSVELQKSEADSTYTDLNQLRANLQQF